MAKGKNKKISVAERKENLEKLDKQNKPKYTEEDFRRDMQAYFAKSIKRLDTVTGDAKLPKFNNKFTKENYRNYLNNMASNIDNLRQMSNFLYRVSTPYKRLIKHFAGIPLFYWYLTPLIEFGEDYDAEKTIKQYNKLAKQLKNMNIPYEFRKVLSTVLREGVFYGFIYEDKNSFFIHKLDPNFCRIRAISAGCYDFHFDMAYFDKHPEYLMWMDPSFNSAYNLYLSNKKDYRYTILDPARSICIKADPDDIDNLFPPLLGLFEALLDLIDARAIQRNKDKIDNYKLISMNLPMFESTKQIDDFKLELDTAMTFYNMLCDAVPPAVGVAISPMELETVDFNNNKDDRADVHSNSMRTVFDEGGVSQSLFNDGNLNIEGLKASIKTDVAWVWEIVEEIEAWIRRYVYFNSKGKNRYNFSILRVDIFNKEIAQDKELALANSGVPNKIKLAATAGLDPVEMISNQIFENDILKIGDSWMPLQTSYTLSGKESEKLMNRKLDEEDTDAKDQTTNAGGSATTTVEEIDTGNEGGDS